jgi:excisionase family DNA binding protein
MPGPSFHARRLVIFLTMTVVFQWCHGSLAPNPVIAQTSAEPEVLTLAEAATLLRLPAQDVARLAQSGKLPGRRIGTSWRFSRVLLLAWLSGDWPPSPSVLARLGEREPDHAAAALRGSQDPLSVGQLRDTRGRGTIASSGADRAQGEQAAPEKTPPGGDASGRNEQPAQPERTRPPGGPGESPPAPIGEKPDLGTARELFLQREGLLIGRQRLTVEVDPTYSKLEDTSVIPFAFVTIPQRLTVRTFQTNFMARYGIADRLQLSARVPQVQTWTSVSAPGLEATKTHDSLWGDVDLAARWSALPEGPTNPEIILSLLGVIPTQSDGAYGLGGGVSFLKSVDPVSLFGSIDYIHSFVDQPIDAPQLQAKELVIAAAGLAVALNDTLSINAQLIGQFSDRPSFGNLLLSSNDRYILQFGFTSILTEHLYVAPRVAFDIGGASNFTFGISIPYTF